MNELDRICARAAADFLALYPKDFVSAADFPTLNRLLGVPAQPEDERSLPRLRFSLLAEEYCAGPGQQAAAEALRCAVASFLYPEFTLLVQRCTGGVCDFPLAWRMAGCGSLWAAPDDASEAFARLRLFLPGLHGGMAGTALAADERLVRYIAGGDEIDALLADVAHFAPQGELPPLYARQELVPPLCEALRRARESGELIHLEGGMGCGKRLLLRRAAAQADITLLEADCRLLAANPLETLWAMLDSLRRTLLSKLDVPWPHNWMLDQAGLMTARRWLRRHHPDAAIGEINRLGGEHYFTDFLECLGDEDDKAALIRDAGQKPGD